MKLTTNYNLATFVLESSTNRNDIFGSNGLPITPSSITIVGNFHSYVNNFNSWEDICPYLINYLDCIRSKNEKVTLVFEHYPSCVKNEPSLFSDIDSLAECGLYGLYHLHYVIGCVHGLVTPNAFLCTKRKDIKYKLSHWAFNLVTNSGQLCQSFIYPDEINFLSLEQLLLLKPTRKSDVWSLGLSLLYFMLPNHRSNFLLDPFEYTNCQTTEDVFRKLKIDLSDLSAKWVRFFYAALNPCPEKRSSIKDLIKLLQLSEPSSNDFIKTFNKFRRINYYTGSTDLINDELFEINNYISIHDFYYLWRITFPSKDADKEEQKLPPILNIPPIIILDNECSNEEHCDPDTSHDELENEINKLVLVDTSSIKVIKLPSNDNFKLLLVDTINERLLKLSNEIFAPVNLSSDSLFHDNRCRKKSNMLPLLIREMDFDYQCERLIMFKALLNGFPFLREQLIEEAKIDICPQYRAQLYASLLNVCWPDYLLYEKIDKLSKTSTDRQIAVDIPRCHQYNDLLASAEGHRKLTRVLKAWLAYNESNGEVYWQGLDSLAAPFVILNFNNEPQAFACFHLFVKKYLKGFFQKDNSAAIHEYLALFQIVTTFHDPALGNHLASLNFVPDLYAISWFLTMFTHILPLYQVVQLWDTLILGNESFPLFIGLSILHQLRDRILDFTFNDCILIFSDLPQIDIDRCVQNSVKFFCSTPKSITKRGLWPLELLRKHSRLARITLEDLLLYIEKQAMLNDATDDNINGKTHSNIVFVDCRSKEEISRFGEIINSVKFEDFCSELQQESQSKNSNSNRTKSSKQIKNNLVIVVNSIEKSMELIENFSVSRLCYLELSSFVPKQLML